MSENDTDKTITTSESTSSTATDTETKTGSATTTSTTTSSTSEYVDDPEEKKETYTFTEDEKVMSDKQYLDSSVDEILSMIKSNSLMSKHSVEETFGSTTRTPSDEPRIVSNILDALALTLEKLEAEMKAVKSVGTSIQNTDYDLSKIAENLGFGLVSKQYAPVSTSGSTGTNVPKYDGDKALTEQTQKYKQEREAAAAGGSPGDSSGGYYPSGDGGYYPSDGGSTTPTSNTPQQNMAIPNTVAETNTPVSNVPETGTNASQESHTTIINNYYYNNRGGGGGGRHSEPAPVVEEPPVEEPVVEEPVIEEPVVEPVIEPEEPPIEEIIEEPIEEEIVEEQITPTVVPEAEPVKSSNTLKKIGVATLVGAGIGAAAYGAHEVMKHKEEKDDYYSSDEEDYATYGYDKEEGEE